MKAYPPQYQGQVDAIQRQAERLLGGSLASSRVGVTVKVGGPAWPGWPQVGRVKANGGFCGGYWRRGKAIVVAVPSEGAPIFPPALIHEMAHELSYLMNKKGKGKLLPEWRNKVWGWHE